MWRIGISRQRVRWAEGSLGSMMTVGFVPGCRMDDKEDNDDVEGMAVLVVLASS